MDGLIGFLIAGFALAGSPGPATLSLAATGAAFGGRRGIVYMAGIVSGMIVVMAVTAGGVTGFVLAVPGAVPAVTVAAGLYFAYLAFRIATAAPLAADGEAGRAPSFAGGLLLSLVNPKGYAAMAALFSGFVLVDGRLGLDAVAKTATMTVVIVAVNVGWLFAGAALTRCFRDSATNRLINVSFAVALVASVGAVLLF
jgi:threonine/homoserine/homoserine lactone efflux protein